MKTKPSNIEWLGELPEHWEVKKLKYIVLDNLKNGLFKKRDEFGSGTKLINVSDIYSKDNIINTNDLERVEANKNEIKNFGVQKGDIFFVRSSLKLEGVASSACVEDISEPVVFECHVVKVSPNKRITNYKYLNYFLNSISARATLISLSQTTTMTTIGQNNISCLKIPLPPLTEQIAIAKFLDRKTTEIDSLIIKKEKLLTLLAERRSQRE